MKKFEIEVKETLTRVVEVESETINTAIEEVYELYKKEEIVLDNSDFSQNTFDIKGLNEFEGNPDFYNYVLSNAEKIISELSIEELARLGFGDLRTAMEKFSSHHYE